MLPIDAFDKTVKSRRNEPALIDDRGILTFAELEQTSHDVARSLAGLGVAANGVVGIYSPNRSRIFEIVLGVWRHGSAWNPISATNTPASNIALLSRAGTSVVFIDARYHHLVSDLKTALPHITTVSLDEKGRCDLGWREFMEGGSDFPSWQTSHANPEHTLMLIGTGGTTGQPKLVVETVRVWNAMQRAFDTVVPGGPGSRDLVTAPASHGAGFLGLLAVVGGRTVHFHDGFNASAVLDAIQEHGIGSLFLPPTAFYDLIDEQLRDERDISSLENLLVAAAPVSPHRLAQGAELFGWKVSQCFGQVEVPMFVAFQHPETIKKAVQESDAELLGSCGQVTPVVTVTIQDADGNILPNNEAGEICIRGALVSKEYFGDPGATAEAHRGGWLHTGDVGVLNENGQLSIRDRIKDMIITGGYNVYAAEVEAALLEHEGVARAAVIGVSDDRWGERVTAIVVPNGGFNDDEELISHAKKLIGPIKAPKEIRWADTLPHTPVGKINKVALRAAF
ncbi:class I adenylate-forming enzyme family protein [Rhodococcus rhodochrous]|uniref:class I adenylate-forming enzyme family protein n=1 Tax=Rhodococcus rhodochrous TaxID=1829 RepID=UPI000ACA06D6|nr:AMP-binding protein [Rhodococcus rhodochrous]